MTATRALPLLAALALLLSPALLPGVHGAAPCPAHCRGGGPGGILRLPGCEGCVLQGDAGDHHVFETPEWAANRPAKKEQRGAAAAAVLVSAASASVNAAARAVSAADSAVKNAEAAVIAEATAATGPVDPSVVPSDKKKKTVCKPWCQWVPASSKTWIPHCQDCKDAAKPKKHKRYPSSPGGWWNPSPAGGLLHFFGLDHRSSSSAPSHAATAATASTAAPGCANWCKLMPAKQIKWIPQCKNCEAAAPDISNDATGNEKKEKCCMNWCDKVPPALMKVVPPCVDCDVPTPTRECPEMCMFVPVKEAALVPACAECYKF